MTAYTRRKAKPKYKDRIWLERASQQQSNGINRTPYDRMEQCRKRKRMNAAERINDGARTSAAGAGGAPLLKRATDFGAMTPTTLFKLTSTGATQNTQLLHKRVRHRQTTERGDTAVGCGIRQRRR